MAFRGHPTVGPAGYVGRPTGATNLVTNGGFETNTTGWAPEGTGTGITSQTPTAGAAPFGTKVMRITGSSATNARSIFNGVVSNPVQGAVYTAQFRIRAGNAGAVGLAALLQIQESGGASGNESSNANVTLTAEWQDKNVTRTIAQSDRTSLDVYVGVFDAAVEAGDQIEVDGVQLETGSIATPYIETDGAAATRQPLKVIA